MSAELNLVRPIGEELYPPQPKPDPARMQRARLLLNLYKQRTAKLTELLECVQTGVNISNTHLLMCVADVEAVVRVITGDAVEMEDF